MTKNIAVIRGDGIGPEIMEQALRGLDKIAECVGPNKDGYYDYIIIPAKQIYVPEKNFSSLRLDISKSMILINDMEYKQNAYKKAIEISKKRSYDIPASIYKLYPLT